ncbi:MAG: BamA/TamA family outer membrane protein [Spirochaetaceae bacterium]|nr:BamA/TamA family outer membrane protein [Myxococcales bacterium]MCB9724200.1 BamA/TamA family outer membrane protein [Spirochaetaceae bacterium]
MTAPVATDRLLPTAILGLGLLLLLPLASTARAAVDDAPGADAPSNGTSEPQGPVVAKILFHGVSALDPGKLTEQIVTSRRALFDPRFWRPDPRLDEFTLEEDLDRIAEAYREAGYFSTRVESAVHEDGADRVVVEFFVEEGPRSHLDRWRLRIEAPDDPTSAPSDAERAALEQIVDVAQGAPFGAALYRKRRRALLEQAAEIGFPFARIEGGAEIDPDDARARVDWTLETGPRTTIGAIHVTGLDRVSEHIVRRELRFAEGERFAPSRLVESERRLVSTGLFRSVAIGRPQEDEAGNGQAHRALDIEIRVEEAKPRSFRASVGYGAEDGPRGEVGLDWRNFLGDARRLQMRGFASLLDAGWEASLGQPYLGSEHFRGDATISALRQQRPGYEAFVTGASALVTWYPDREGPFSLAIGPGYELTEMIRFAVDIGRPLRGPADSVIVPVFAVARYEDVDDRLDPRRGFRISLESEAGTRSLGSDLDHLGLTLDLRGYLPTGPIVWAARAAASILDPFGGGLSELPLTRRLYSGGTNSVRGFGFQKLGPQDSGNDPIGGLSRIETGIEARLHVWKAIGIVGFIDAGDVREDSWHFRPTELRASAGPGLRVATPVGPLRLDFGFLLNRPGNTDPWRFHLSVGHAF